MTQTFEEFKDLVQSNPANQRRLRNWECSALIRGLREPAYKALHLTEQALLDKRAFSAIDTRSVVCVASSRLLEFNMVAALLELGYQIIHFRSGSPDLVFERLKMKGGVELKWLDRNVGVVEIQRLIDGVNTVGGVEVLLIVSRTPLTCEAYRLLKRWGEVATVETNVTFLEKERLASWNQNEWN
jgi:hypothetical protein